MRAETPAEELFERIVDRFDGFFERIPESPFLSIPLAYAVGVPLMGVMILFARGRLLYTGVEMDLV